MGKISDALDKIDTLNRPASGPAQRQDQEESAAGGIAPQPGAPAAAPRPSAGRIDSGGRWDARLFQAANRDAEIPGLFKSLWSTMSEPRDGRAGPRTVLIASAGRGEGKSFVAANLAVSLATGDDRHCVLVDGDLRHPRLAAMFGVTAEAGLADYLSGRAGLDRLIVGTPVRKLLLVPGGPPPPDPARLFDPAGIARLTGDLATKYGQPVVIFDSPAILDAEEAPVLAGAVDAVLLVIRRGRVKRAEIQTSIDRLGADRVTGIITNCMARSHARLRRTFARPAA